MACSYAWSSLGYHCLCAASLLCTLRRSAERKRPSLARWPREMNTMLADVRSDGEGGGLLTVPCGLRKCADCTEVLECPAHTSLCQAGGGVQAERCLRLAVSGGSGGGPTVAPINIKMAATVVRERSAPPAVPCPQIIRCICGGLVSVRLSSRVLLPLVSAGQHSEQVVG